MRLHLRPKLALPVAALALAVAGAALSPAASSAPAAGTSARQAPGIDANRAQAASGKPVNLDWPRPGGALVDGGLMVAHPGTWTGAQPIAFTYEWKWCYGGELDDWCVPAGSGPRYVVVRVVPPLLRLVVTATNSAGSERLTIGLPQLGDPQIPPFLVDPPRLFGTPKVGELLEATEGIWYAPASTQFTFHWWRCAACQAPIELAADPPGSNQYLVTAADVGSGIYADVKADPVTPPGQAICCPATNTLYVAPALAPEPLAKPTIEGPSPPRVGDLLTATDGEWAGAQPMTFTYTWYGCLNVAAWNIPLGCNQVGHAKTYIPTPADVGSQLAVSVGAYNAYGSYGQLSDPTEPVQAAGSSGGPVNTSRPTVTGTTAVGDTLSASEGTWNGATLPFTYQWERCPGGCEAIPGATLSTYTVANTDVPNRLRVVVTARNDAGATSSASDLTDTAYGGVFEDALPPKANFGGYSYRSPGNGPDFLGARSSIAVPWDDQWRVPSGAFGYFRVVVQRCGGSRTDCPFLAPNATTVPLIQVGVVKSNRAGFICGDAPVPWTRWEYKDDSLDPFMCGYGPSTEPDRAVTYMVRRRPPSAVGGSDEYWGAFADGQMLVSQFLGFSTSFWMAAGGEINQSKDAGIRACYGPKCVVTNEDHPQPAWSWTSTAGGGDWNVVQPQQVEQRNGDGRWINEAFSTSGFNVEHVCKPGNC